MGSETYKSYLITKLDEELKKGNNKVLDEFWNKVSKEGLPLIEAVDGTENILVTFVYKAEKQLENVLLMSSIRTSLKESLQESVMNNLNGTNLWYKTYKVKNDICSMYYFLENYPVDDTSKSHDSKIIRDKFNSLRLTFGVDDENPDEKSHDLSYFKAPNAENFIWTKEDENIPKGSFHKHLVYSNRLGKDVRVWVYTPWDYDENDEPYSLISLLDGIEFINTNMLCVGTVLDNVNNSKTVKLTIGLLIDNDEQDEKRFKNLSCNDDFAFFIAEELIAWVREHYNVSKEPNSNIISGFSLGGLMSTYIALKYPNVFGNVLSQSASFWYAPKEEDPNMISREIDRLGKLPIKFYLNIGVLENTVSMIATNEKVRDTLIENGYDVVYEEFKAGHDYIYWGEKLAQGLIILNGYGIQ